MIYFHNSSTVKLKTYFKLKCVIKFLVIVGTCSNNRLNIYELINPYKDN